MAFPVNATLDELKAGPFRGRLSADETEHALLAFMLRPLTHEEATARRERFGVTREVGEEQHYRCVYWDEETRLCSIYEQRPEMCRDYPGRRACEHACDGCELAAT